MKSLFSEGRDLKSNYGYIQGQLEGMVSRINFIFSSSTLFLSK